MERYFRIHVVLLSFIFVLGPKPAKAQLEVLLDFLIYDYGILFGFEGEPGAFDIDFTTYPYQYDDVGLYLFPDEIGRRMNTYVDFRYQSNEDDVAGGWMQVKFSPISTITIDINHLQLYESVFAQDGFRYSFTNFSFQYNRVRGPRFHFWWSLGVTRFGGNVDDTEVGGSLGIGATYYIRKPVSLYTDFRWSYFPNTLGTTGVYDIRVQTHHKQFTVYAGLNILDGDFDWLSWSLGAGIHF
ncbi:MAG: hypothetical protein AAF985_23760 [Bacteroidota bacterium]